MRWLMVNITFITIQSVRVLTSDCYMERGRCPIHKKILNTSHRVILNYYTLFHKRPSRIQNHNNIIISTYFEWLWIDLIFFRKLYPYIKILYCAHKTIRFADRSSMHVKQNGYYAITLLVNVRHSAMISHVIFCFITCNRCGRARNHDCVILYRVILQTCSHPFFLK